MILLDYPVIIFEKQYPGESDKSFCGFLSLYFRTVRFPHKKVLFLAGNRYARLLYGIGGSKI